MFDISDLTIKELIELNCRVTERLRELESLKNAVLMDNFRLGDPVFFIPPNGSKVCSIVIKKNQKTISVLDDSGNSWNVLPIHLVSQGTENVFDADWEKNVKFK
ncbi:MAG: hypothetical protein GY920_03285 [Aliivibrio sp.]|nr:hypothetical protein [Aliivibrio sp.]